MEMAKRIDLERRGRREDEVFINHISFLGVFDFVKGIEWGKICGMCPFFLKFTSVPVVC